jgi:hypothetical protein
MNIFFPHRAYGIEDFCTLNESSVKNNVAVGGAYDIIINHYNNQIINLQIEQLEKNNPVLGAL